MRTKIWYDSRTISERRAAEYSLPKGNFEVAERNAASTPIQDRGERSDDLREPATTFSRQARNDFCSQQQRTPLEAVAKFFPPDSFCHVNDVIITARFGKFLRISRDSVPVGALT